MTKETVKIHGKDYEVVASRVNRFRTDKPDWSIITEVLEWDMERGEIIVEASIVDEKQMIRASGMAHEKETTSQINKTSYVECAETSAIGRALACMNYQGGEYASADELVTALANQSTTSKDTPRSDKTSDEITKPQLGMIMALIKELGIDTKEWKVQPNELSKFGASKTIEKLQEQKKALVSEPEELFEEDPFE